MHVIMQALPKAVTSLSLAGCDLVTGSGLGRLTRLRSLRFSSSPKVTPSALQVRAVPCIGIPFRA